MSEIDRLRYLKFALRAFAGVFVFGVYPLTVLWPSGWAWHAGAPYDSQYFMMIVGIYVVIGVFLLMAARKPEANTSFIWFAVWSSLVHAVIMAVQSVGHGHHMGHLWGDVPALLAVAVILTILVRAADLERLEPAAST